MAAAARGGGGAVTAERGPPYLPFSEGEVPAGAPQLKCAPPIRSRHDRELLWTALREEVVSMIVSDHSPAPPDMKLRGGDFFAAWGGIASLELGLSALWTEARERGFEPPDLARWMSQGPARLVGLGHRKGRIAAGFDADLVMWDPDASFVVDPARLYHRHPVTPYAGRELFGVVRRTYVLGRLAHAHD